MRSIIKIYSYEHNVAVHSTKTFSFKIGAAFKIVAASLEARS